VSAQYTLFDAGALSVAGLERLVESLPATTRAQLKWSPVEIRSALATYLEGDKGEASIKKLANALTGEFRKLSAAIISLADHAELFRSELEEVWRAEATSFAAAVEPDAADAADWVIHVWRAFFDYALSAMQDARAELPKLLADANADTEFEEFMSQPGSPLRAQALMMAASESVRLGLPRASTSELVFHAFDEAVLLLQNLHRVGIHVDPFRGETLAERGARVLRYASHLRSALSESDEKELEASRLRTLR
jgi:hypothetical protein